MTRRRWIADEVSGGRAALTGAHAEHLIRVLRVRVGQQFDVSANSVLYRARVVAIGEQRVEFELEEELSASSTSLVQTTLLLSIIKFDRMEWAIEKCTEVGIARCVPLIAARTHVHLASAARNRVERWRRIAREASEQARRASPPEITDPLKLKEAVSLPSAKRIFLSESENPSSTLMNVLNAHDSSLLLAIGPEGGWTAREEELFRECGWTSASLGATILRAETAAIVAAAIASQLQSRRASQMQ